MNRILFLKTATSSWVPQDGNGNRIKICIRLRLVASDEYRQKISFALAADQNSYLTEFREIISAWHCPQPNLASNIFKLDQTLI
jgi:hypothetical protein